MKKNIIIIISIFLFSLKSSGQCQDQNLGYNKYPGICVQNAIKWLNMSRANWTTEMKKYDFKDTGFSERGAPYFSSGSSHSNIGVQLIITKDFDLLQIDNFPTRDKQEIFQDIINQLEPYYQRRDGNWIFFSFKYTDDNSYEFAVSQSSMMDLIWVRKI